MSSRQQQQQQQQHAEAAAALQRYGAFVDEVLKPQLQQTLAKRDAIAREAAEYAELRALLDELQASHANGEPLHTLMEIGEQFRVRAKVKDTRMVTVDIGLNFHVEMTVPEARAFVDKHLQHLAEKRNAWQEKAREVSEHVNLVLDAIQKLAVLQ